MTQMMAGSLFIIPMIAGLFAPSYKIGFALGALWNIVMQIVHPTYPLPVGGVAVVAFIASLGAPILIAAAMSGIGFGIRRLIIWTASLVRTKVSR